MVTGRSVHGYPHVRSVVMDVLHTASAGVRHDTPTKPAQGVQPSQAHVSVSHSQTQLYGQSCPTASSVGHVRGFGVAALDPHLVTYYKNHLHIACKTIQPSRLLGELDHDAVPLHRMHSTDACRGYSTPAKSAAP